MKTPIGHLHIRAKGDVLLALELSDEPAKDAMPRAIAEPLRAYFEGDLDALARIEVDFETGTAFQRAVWAELRRIPAGKTISYGEQAARIGRPTATRAVGAANGQNPIALVVPCHRVIGKDGSLTGYASGIERKRWLLAHERGQTLEPAAQAVLHAAWKL